MKNDVQEMIQKLNDIMDWAKYDYELSDIPGFREPADKRTDRQIVDLCEKALECLDKLKDLL